MMSGSSSIIRILLLFFTLSPFQGSASVPSFESCVLKVNLLRSSNDEDPDGFSRPNTFLLLERRWTFEQILASFFPKSFYKMFSFLGLSWSHSRWFRRDHLIRMFQSLVILIVNPVFLSRLTDTMNEQPTCDIGIFG